MNNFFLYILTSWYCIFIAGYVYAAIFFDRTTEKLDKIFIIAFGQVIIMYIIGLILIPIEMLFSLGIQAYNKHGT